MSKSHKILLIIATFVALASLVASLFIETKKQVVKDVEEQSSGSADREERFSRAAFFLSNPPICGISLPESWEGNYRLRDGASGAVFYYFDDSGERELFRIASSKVEDFKEHQGKELARKNGLVYSYSLSTAGAEAPDKYVDMQGRVGELVKSFSCQ